MAGMQILSMIVVVVTCLWGWLEAEKTTTRKAGHPTNVEK